MYTQTLYKVIEPIKINTIKRLNKSKKWEYGYNKEHDIIVISKTGQIGEIYEIQNLRIALPKSQSVCKKHNKWIAKDYPKELQKLVSHCPCGKCAKCKCWEWYNEKKKEGFSAIELDDIIMKEGKYGKYFTKESNPETRHIAYVGHKFRGKSYPDWNRTHGHESELSSQQVLPTKPHN